MSSEETRRLRNREYARQSRERKRREFEALQDYDQNLREALSNAERQISCLQETLTKTQQELEATRQGFFYAQEEQVKLRTFLGLLRPMTLFLCPQGSAWPGASTTAVDSTPGSTATCAAYRDPVLLLLLLKRRLLRPSSSSRSPRSARSHSPTNQPPLKPSFFLGTYFFRELRQNDKAPPRLFRTTGPLMKQTTTRTLHNTHTRTHTHTHTRHLNFTIHLDGYG